MDLNTASATAIARSIRQREVSCEAVVRHFIEKQKEWNPRLNALVENRWDEALEEARGKDEYLAQNPGAAVPPLFGVPFTIKEMIAVAGYKSTLGSIHRRDHVEKRDSSVVQRLREAGAIIVGTTNVPELGFWFECDNPVYGTTVNPFDPTRTAGGSSGGEAALVGAGASLVGLGSDVGGSIRMPAGFCGIFGHKPSNRIVPITGHYPIGFDNAATFTGHRYPLTTIGPLTRHAEDLRTVLALLLGEDGFDTGVRKDFRLGDRITSWEGAKVWILPNPTMKMVGATDEAESEAVTMAGKYFESMGAELKILRHDFLKDAVLMWSTGLSEVEGRSFEESLFADEKPSIPFEIVRSFTKDARYTLPGLLTTLTERLALKAQKNLPKLIEKRQVQLHKLRDDLNLLLEGPNIMILPTHPRTAPKLRSTYLRPFDFAMTGVFNALGMPVTAVPVARSEGLPTSVQIVSAWGQDHVTLSAAETLEQAFGGWQAPPLTEA